MLKSEVEIILQFTLKFKKMKINRFNPGPAKPNPTPSSKDMKRKYENATDGKSTLVDNSDEETPTEIPERSHKHDYKDPAGNQVKDNEDKDEETEDEIKDDDIKNDPAAQVDEKSMNIEDRGLV